MATNTKLVEVMVRRDIKKAALLRAQSQAQNLSAVCRAVVTRVSAGAQYPGGGEPRLRRDKDDRVKLRFVADRVVYEAAKQRANGAVSSLIEDALEEYAINGRI